MSLEGTKVVVAGTFTEKSRDELVAALREKGAVIADDLAPDVEYAFVGDDAGYVPDEARELGVPVRDLAALQEMLSGGGAKEKPLPPVDNSLPELPPGHPAATGSPVDDGSPAPASSSKSSGSSSSRPAAGAPATSPASGEKPTEFGKGVKVKIVGGTEGVGKVGHIFWWGDSKFGDGMRAGVKGEDEETYWVDEENLGWPDEEVPQDILELAEQANEFSKGDRVRVKSGKNAGDEGTIFWWGESKWGDGMRAGIKTDDDETVWADADLLEAVDDGGSAADAGDDPIPF